MLAGLHAATHRRRRPHHHHGHGHHGHPTHHYMQHANPPYAGPPQPSAHGFVPGAGGPKTTSAPAAAPSGHH